MSPEHAGVPAQFWDELYRESRWSGDVNVVLERIVAPLSPGTALDLGCGEGGDAIWLAGRGWQVRAVDISQVALDRATGVAAGLRLTGRIRWERHDLDVSFPDGSFDLVSAQFLHSPVALARDQILLRARDAVAPGGLLLVVGHAYPPPWATGHEKAPPLPTTEQVVRALELDRTWTVEVAERAERPVTGPDGQPAMLTDSVVAVRLTG